ncbi:MULTISPECIES: sugar ABC transporter ATP-binding protein [Marivita]|jgi:ribose transport system ATP-binding protein|uniref:Sugar ABC transporter ATP-binding protein n=1 Tax=Marivita cryptomonadis TaxID=505252 RepID=A0A9Q2NZ24_9RHOB|nr:MULTISPECIES: sugar ABC transporter ATP-binding protein [Marivita]MCR9168543.1 sugar ABC transporter ATP-binding protein [Paracoccaceae bacterium]MBM2323868.1 sugar ABC transporter ATP-binding protein [Marivita cryptomonadis]MBM2333457.1 sugar ABC transporter ATP-binding protein [Marivita cryptomonadis]MBM2343035.1 sugar ABC transporter ATP-binding protein [Marivita cryptomonadis]MBM2347706.1 sugar ABC transporter ATP-binding protein [Marivita cryptomonadis]
MTDQTPVLRLEDIVKTFPGVRALDGVSFSVLPGEVHALMGENGAGKSTLMKVLGGILQPNEGRIFIEEEPTVMTTPVQAKAKGVVFIHQELSLADELTVAENIWLGELPLKSFGRVNWAKLYEDTNAILKTLNVGFDAKTRVGDLSIANQQMVEIARALTVDPKAVIFDEPTASLTDAEKVVLFDVISDLQSKGVGIIYISHRMEEIFKITDRISVLRDGQYRGTLNTRETDEEEVTKLMIGRSLDLSRNESHHEMGDVALEVRGLSCGKLYQDVSFNVRKGEVLGFYGLVGAGRTEIAETLFGLRDPSAGQILLNGQEVRIKSPIDAIANGISLVPEDRKGQGLVLGMNCRDNMTLPQVDDLTAGPFVSDGAEIAIFDQYRDKLDIRTPGWRQTVGNLSGGNQQKIVIGKWLSMRPEVLIVDEPTRGIDVGSKSEIHNLIRDLAAQGYAVIVISSEMPEVLHVSDRIVAMYSGKVMREFTSDEVTEDSLIQAISGITADKVA